MSSATLEQLTIPAVEPVQRFVFHDIDWNTYLTISDALPDRHFRMAYDGSNLEIMSKSSLHGRLSMFVCYLVRTLAEELKTGLVSAGDFTLRREDVERGIEPDQCFYVKNADKVRTKRRIDILVDPPPDLAVEVDVSRSCVSRLPIYARLSINEVWKLTESKIECLLLQGGTYVSARQSDAFPEINPGDLFSFVARIFETEESALLDEFRVWVRERFAAN